MTASRATHEPSPPLGFRVRRDLPVGRHPLLAAFPGLEKLDTARRLESDDAERERLFDATCVEVVSEDVWMYVAPFDLPKGAPKRWRPVTSPGGDCIVVGEGHLRESPEIILFLDIFHELCHVRQRRAGAQLFNRKVSYVRRPTEVAAYQFAVTEARILGANDAFLREYLRVEWVDDDELSELLGVVGVRGGAHS